MDNSALILIDIQRDYFADGAFPLPTMQDAAENAVKVLTNFRKQKLPIWHIQHIEHDPSGSFFLPDSEGAKIHQSVLPIDGERLIVKHYPNSFRDTALLKELHIRGIHKIIFCGAMSNMCVDATVRAAFDFGFECTVVHDACAASEMEFNGKHLGSEDVQAAFMGSLGSAYAQVIDCAALCE